MSAPASWTKPGESIARGMRGAAALIKPNESVGRGMRVAAGRFPLRTLMLMLFTSLGGCVADGGYGGGADYDGSAAVGYGVDFYEPYGYEYGGCCGRDRVGPPRRGDDHGHDHGPTHSPN